MHLDDKLSPSGNTESQSQPLTVAELVRDRVVLRGLHRIAESRARLPRGSPDAEDLVAGVIADLATEVITPDLQNLHSQAIGLVRQRADKYERDAQKSVTCYLDDAPAEALADESADTDDSTALELPLRRREAIEAIRALAVGDKPVQQLLELWARGFTRRRDAWSVGMTPAVYRTARERVLAYGQRARSELAALEARSDDVVENFVRGQFKLPKSGKPRSVPLSAQAREALAAHHHGIERVFCDASGKPYTKGIMELRLHKMCRLAGLRPIGWHTLRHTFASHLVMRGVPIRVVQDLMGHGSIVITQRYAHLMPHVSQDAVCLLDGPSRPTAALKTEAPGAETNSRRVRETRRATSRVSAKNRQETAPEAVSY